MNLYLIGYRCTGKTTVGRRLARLLGRRFYDADAEVVERCGMTIAEMVEKNGWPAFRELEKETILRLSRKTDVVVATGGGVILDPGNVSAMKRSGRVVWLTAEIDTIRRRMAADGATADLRPALKDRKNQGAPDEIGETLLERIPLYENAADYPIETDQLTPDAVADRILEWINETDKET